MSQHTSSQNMKKLLIYQPHCLDIPNKAIKYNLFVRTLEVPKSSRLSKRGKTKYSTIIEGYLTRPSHSSRIASVMKRSKNLRKLSFDTSFPGSVLTIKKIWQPILSSANFSQFRTIKLQTNSYSDTQMLGVWSREIKLLQKTRLLQNLRLRICQGFHIDENELTLAWLRLKALKELDIVFVSKYENVDQWLSHFG